MTDVEILNSLMEQGCVVGIHPIDFYIPIAAGFVGKCLWFVRMGEGGGSPYRFLPFEEIKHRTDSELLFFRGGEIVAQIVPLDDQPEIDARETAAALAVERHRLEQPDQREALDDIIGNARDIAARSQGIKG